MNLTKDQRDLLYMIIWQEPTRDARNAWGSWAADNVLKPLTDAGLVEVKDGHYVGTTKGRNTLSPDARTACQRPKNYSKLPESEQWAVDRRLGILDWDGN